MKNKTTKKKPKHGLYFKKYKRFYYWQLWDNGILFHFSEIEAEFMTLDEAILDITTICQILYPHTIENQVVTEAVERFKKEKK